MDREKCTASKEVNYGAYKEKVQAFRKQDAAANFAAGVVLNGREKKLDALMDKFRKRELNDRYVYLAYDPQKGFGQPERKPKEPVKYYPIHPFNEVKEEIEHSSLFGVFRDMPKGGNLHIHTSATLGTDRFIDLLRQFDDKDGWSVYVWIKKPDKKAGSDPVEGTLYLLSDDFQIPKDVSAHLKRIKEFEDDEQLRSYYSLMNVQQTREVKYIWDEFNNIFARFSKILLVRDFYMEYYRQAFEELTDDNIDYVELRFGPSLLVADNRDAVSELSSGYKCGGEGSEKWDSIDVIWDVYRKFRETHEDFKLKLIVSGSRRKKDDDDRIEEKIYAALKKVYSWMTEPKYKKENFVIGYDLVSEEDRGNSTDFYAKAIYNCQFGKIIPFYFHDGESCWADDDNLYAAAALGTRRVGHGLNLFRFPVLVEFMKERRVALEVCPISNQLLRYTPDLRMHLIGEYMNRGVECVVCSDDPTILGNGGLAYDFWEVYASQIIGLREIKKLIINSYMYSGMDDEEYCNQIRQWEKKWEAFVDEAIATLESEDI